MQMGGIDPQASAVCVKQSSVCEVLFCGCGHAVYILTPWDVSIDGQIRTDQSALYFIPVPCAFRTGIYAQAVPQLHGSIVAHDHLAPVTIVGQGSTVQQCKIEVGIFKRCISDVGDLSYLVDIMFRLFVKIDSTRGDCRFRDSHAQDLIDGVIFVGEKISR